MKIQTKIALVSAFGCGLIAYNLWPFLGGQVFYKFTALEFVLLYYAAASWLPMGIWKRIVFVFFLCATNSLLDELFFDPKAIDLNEYIGFAIIILTSFFLTNERFFRILQRFGF